MINCTTHGITYEMSCPECNDRTRIRTGDLPLFTPKWVETARQLLIENRNGPCCTDYDMALRELLEAEGYEDRDD